VPSKVRMGRWGWVVAAALVIVYAGYVFWTWYSPYKEDVRVLCDDVGPQRTPTLLEVKPDWRWFPPAWWCTYRWKDGVTASHPLDELG
jgi:hypothetical protein